jgi:hypothetical protein
LTSTEDIRAWHQKVTQEEDERRVRFQQQLRKINAMSSDYADEAQSGADFPLYQRAAERTDIDTSRAQRLVELLEAATGSEDFILDIRDISV